MAEEAVKTHRPPPDPNSAKFKLNKIANDAYADAAAAKARGEMIGWCASNFPVEIPETLGLAVVYPENQAAGIAARGAGVTMCEEAESEGYSNDICAYARISLAYAKLKQAPVDPNVTMPDFVLCCNNICNCMIKWYENLAHELHIPMFIIDIPFNPDYEVSDEQIAYVRAQFWDVIHGLEKLTGKQWSDERYKEVMEISGRTSRAWLAATACARYTPSPFNGFDLLNHMAVMVTARGKLEAAEAMETLLREYEQNHAEGKSTFRSEEKYRIMFEGIACWPWLRVTSNGLKGRGINMVTTIYADAFGFVYRSQLAAFLQRYAAGRNLQFELLEFESADKLLINYPRDLDLLFLDIAMGGVDGMEAARELRKFDSQVCIIFITTMYQYAIDGYAVKAFGFIKKPVSEAELQHELTCALAQIHNTRAREQFLTIKSGGVLHRLPISHISCCEVRNHEIILRADGQLYQTREAMGELEMRLKPLGFFRCHSSFLVNGGQIAKIEPLQITLLDGTVVPISQRRRKEFMQEISSFLGGTI